MTEEREIREIFIDVDRGLPEWCDPIMVTIMTEAMKCLKEAAPEIEDYIRNHNPDITAEFYAYIARCTFWLGVGVGEQGLLNSGIVVEDLKVDKVKKDKE